MLTGLPRLYMSDKPNITIELYRNFCSNENKLAPPQPSQNARNWPCVLEIFTRWEAKMTVGGVAGRAIVAKHPPKSLKKHMIP